jgi:hypothetical protein
MLKLLFMSALLLLFVLVIGNCIGIGIGVHVVVEGVDTDADTLATFVALFGLHTTNSHGIFLTGAGTECTLFVTFLLSLQAMGK